MSHHKKKKNSKGSIIQKGLHSKAKTKRKCGYNQGASEKQIELFMFYIPLVMPT